MAGRKETRSSKQPATPVADPAHALIGRVPVASAVSDEPANTLRAETKELGKQPILSDDLVPQIGPLFDMIRHHETQLPLAAVIYGAWGSGKTTAMEWLKSALDTWTATTGKQLIKDKKLAKDHFIQTHCVWFYPWKYQTSDDVLRGIIAEVIRETIMVANCDAQTVTAAIRRFGGFLGKSCLRVLDSIELSAGTDATGKAKVTLGAARGVIEEFKAANEPDKPFLNHFEDSLSEWIKSTIGKDKRLVVFIDDLDRCLPRVALQVLEALKLYLRIPQIVFVIGVDRRVVTQLVKTIYTADGIADVDPKRYLAKMFQVEVTLDANEDNSQRFFDHLTDGHDVWDKLALAPEARKLFRDYILSHAERNPREIKRVFNGAVMKGAGQLYSVLQERSPVIKRETVRHGHDAGAESHAQTEALAIAQGMKQYFIQHRLDSLESLESARIAKERAEQKPATTKEVIRESHEDEHNEQQATKPARLLSDLLEPMYPPIRHIVSLQGTLRMERFMTSWAELLRSPDSAEDVTEAMLNQAPRWHWHNESPKDHLGENLPKAYAAFATQVNFKDFAPLLADQWLRLLLALDLDGSSADQHKDMPTTGDTAEQKVVKSASARALQDRSRHARQAILTGATKDARIVRDAAALALKVSPDELTDAMLAKELTELDLVNAEVTTIDCLIGLTSLTSLWLDYTAVSNIEPLAHLTSLTTLSLNGTAVSNIEPLAHLTSLTSLSLGGTAVSNIEPLAHLTSLTTLSLDNTAVGNIEPLKTLDNLTELWFDDTSVGNIEPLAHLTSLTTLSLSRTAVGDIEPFEGLDNLNMLWLDGTAVSDIEPLKGLANLTGLWLTDSPAAKNKNAIEAIMKAIPHCSIYI
ncbi:MAG: hypothetical protein H6815_06965 [Phycisphaeraceae bacterium]|nr:hypothetical protein [Phycisphaerales bacterium]MCB9860180.1 hypothetical protein [Phycisphaeraceae bacterium]